MLLQMESLHSFYGWVVFRCICIYNSLISSWTLGYFHILTMVNNAVMNMEVHIFFWIMVFSDICPLTPILMSTFPSTSKIPHSSSLYALRSRGFLNFLMEEPLFAAQMLPVTTRRESIGKSLRKKEWGRGTAVSSLPSPQESQKIGWKLKNTTNLCM